MKERIWPINFPCMLKVPSRYLPFKSREMELRELDQDGQTKEEFYASLVGNRKSLKRGRGTREQGSGRKYQRRTPGAREIMNSSNYRQRQVGAKSNGSQGRKRGRRTVRKKPERRGMNGRFISRTANTAVDTIIPSSNNQEFLENEEEEDWGVENVNALENNNNMEEDVEISNSADEAVDSDDDNVQGMEYEQDDDNGEAMEYQQGNWDHNHRDFDGDASNGWNREMIMEESDEDMVSGDDRGGDEEAAAGYDYSEAEVDVVASDGSDQPGNGDDIDSEYSD